MPYWLTEILRRTRRRGQHSGTTRDDQLPPLRTAEERVQEQEAWEQARQRVEQRQAENERQRDQTRPAR
jgi:hypothetical protein